LSVRGNFASPATSRQVALGFRWPATLGKKYALQVGCISQNPGLFHGLGSLRTRRHAARRIERRQRLASKSSLDRGFCLSWGIGAKLRQRFRIVCSVFDSGTSAEAGKPPQSAIGWVEPSLRRMYLVEQDFFGRHRLAPFSDHPLAS
jgi:hypothetical protein